MALQAVTPEKQSALPQFMILIYEREVPDSVRAAPPTVLETHMRLPGRIAETGGRIIGGNALRPASKAISVQDNAVVSGSIAGSAHTLAGYFIVEASDLDHAVWIGRMVPVADGWVEVRPVLMS
ncbi:YciI family protein [Actinoplanes sp. NPDC049265]|uniref:YciI family protein n=1 Tax=Actinoplanes sp. NPDC049265 TaxID=3363902 RepID=UPI00371018B5